MIPIGWANNVDSQYWAADTNTTGNGHFNVNIRTLARTTLSDEQRHSVFFQVLTAQRTMIVNLPADQSMYTTMVEVVTFDINDSITGGSLIAELALIERPNSLIELGDPFTSEVAIEHNLVVTVTGLGGESSVSADEGSNVNLRLNVTPRVDNDLNLNVSLSYTNINGTPETMTIGVLAGSTGQNFSIPVGGGDDIAAQSTRTFTVTVLPGLNYVVGDPSRSVVGINVLNDDSAVVSISAESGPVTEGNSALFEVQVSGEIATSLIATIELTTIGGEFGIDLDDTIDVVIVAGETTALLTVTTGGDIDEVDGSLTARIISLAPGVPVSGVQPEVGVNSATVMIQDDDELLVRITTLDGDPSMTISESDDIRLLLTLSDAINRNLPVNSELH